MYQSVAQAINDGKNSYLDEKGNDIDIGLNITPFYPLVMVGIYRIFGWSYNNVYAFNFILSILTILILYFVMRKISTAFITIIFILLFLIYYPLWKMIYSLLFEIPTIFLLSLAIYLFILSRITEKVKYYYLYYFTFSLLILVNNRFIFHFVVITLYLFIISLKERKRIKETILGILIVIILLTPWFIRQYYHYNQFVLFTPKWTNMANKAIGYPPDIEVDSPIYSFGEKKILGSYEEYLEIFENVRGEYNYKKSFTREKYLKIISKFNPEDKLKLYLSRFRLFWTPIIFDYRLVHPNDPRILMPSTLPQVIIGIIFLFPLMILSVLGSLLSFIKKDYFMLICTLLLFAHLTLHVAVHFIPRYRYTIMPVMLILALYALKEIKLFIGKRRLESVKQ